MKKEITTVAILIIGCAISCAQTAQGLVSVDVLQRPEPFVSLSSESIVMPDPVMTRKDPMILIQQGAEDPALSDNLMFKIKPAWAFFYSQEKSVPIDDNRFSNKRFVDVYMASLRDELHAEPFYYVGREDIRADEFIYQEEAWDALADALRKKYRVIRMVDWVARQAEDVVTVKYKSSSGCVLKARPGIERLEGKDSVILRLSADDFAGIDKVDARLRPGSARLRVGNALHGCSIPCLVYLEYETFISSDEAQDTHRQNALQAYFEMPLW